MNDLSTQASKNSPATRKDAATYTGLFPDSQTRCAPGALEANNGRLAYLAYLRSLIEAFETRADVSAPITLHTRRPDLLQLRLDAKNAKRSLPTLRLVLGVLESRAREVLVGQTTLQQAVAAGAYQGNVPFHAAWETIKATLAVKKLSLWEAIGSCAEGAPSFALGNLTLPACRAAITLSNGFSPQLTTLLLTQREPDEAFYHTHFQGTEKNALGTSQGLCKALGITRKHLRQLLAVSAIGQGQTSVTRSANVSTADVEPPSSKVHGAAFINNGSAPLYLTQPDPADKTVQITGMTTSHLDRLQRILRVQRALELEPVETDAVLMAALHAEGQLQDYQLTPATLRALGLFRHLQQQYGASAAQFAAFIHEISPYGNDRTASFFDQLFNPESAEEGTAPTPPLVLDGSAFDPKATEGVDAQTMKLLCLALNVDTAILKLVLEQVLLAQGLGQPTRSLAVISACYRMIALPRLFGISAESGGMLLGLLNQENPVYARQLAGVPSLSSTTEADIVDVIVGFMGALEWFKHEALDITQLVIIVGSGTPIVQQAWNQAFTDDLDNPFSTVEDKLRKALAVESDEHLISLLRWANVDAETLVFRMKMIDLQRRTERKKPVDCFDEADTLEWFRLERYAALARLFKLSAGMLNSLTTNPASFDLQGNAGATLRALDLTTVYQLTRHKALLARMVTGRSESDLLHCFSEAAKADGVDTSKAWTALEQLLGKPEGSLSRLDTLTPPTTVSQLDRLMRLHDLADRQGLSVDTLLGLGELVHTHDYTAFERSATALRQGCSSRQRKALDEQQRLAWRDALVSWMLVHWAPADAGRSWINSPQTLADYLLLDLQVAEQPLTTRVLSATASLQRYLHQIHSRLENGYRTTAISEQERDEWVDFASQYERWKLREDVRNEPQNFIDPTRRQHKTTAFKELESQLAQGKCQPEEIQAAMLGYLSTFETLSNIQVISVYADGTSPLTDTYHFIGKTNVEPVAYYWRTLDMSQRDQDNAPSMLAWGEWQKIALPVSGKIAMTPLPKPEHDDSVIPLNTQEVKLDEDKRTHLELIRPVIIAGRRYVVWVERETSAIVMGSDNKPSVYYPLRVCFAFQQTDGAWSPPNELLRLDGHDEKGTFISDEVLTPGETGTATGNAFLKTKAYEPGLIVMVNSTGDRQNDPWLTVLLFDAHSSNFPKANWKCNENYFIVVKDLLLIETKQLDAKGSTNRVIEQKLVDNWLKFFRDPRVVQHPYIGTHFRLQENIAKQKPVSWYDGTPPSRFKVDSEGDLSLSGVISRSQEISVSAMMDSVLREKYIWRVKPIKLLVDTTNKTKPRISLISIAKNKDKAKIVLSITGFKHIGRLYDRLSTTLVDTDSNKFFKFDNGIDEFEQAIHLDYETNIDFRPDKLSLRLNKRESNKDPAKTIYLDFKLTSVSCDDITAPYSRFNTRLTATLSFEKNATWTLSNRDQQLLGELKLNALKNLATEKADHFKQLKNWLLKTRYITPQMYHQHLGTAESTPADTEIAAALAIKRAQELNAADATSAFIASEVAALHEAKLTLPDGLLPESLLRLLHLHPVACRKILLYLDPEHQMVFEDTQLADGKMQMNAFCPIHRDVPEYTFTFELYADGDSEKPLGSISRTYTLKDEDDDSVPSVQVCRNPEQALYLDLSEANEKASAEQKLAVNSLRLNTLFGKQLVALATQSVERALSWEAQCLPEPRLEPGSAPCTVDFRSANGHYFWELFFHAPFLVSWLLRQNREYREAARWYTRYLFDPYRTETAQRDTPPAYWLTQPIVDRSAFAAAASVNDPDLLAYAAPIRYRMALHLFVVESGQRQGDDLYRQLTRDTLVEAAICYDRALRLIGRLPENLSSTSRQALTLSEANVSDFASPLNNKLIELRNLLRNRLFNLRHGLTLDGKPAALLLDPQALDQALLGYAGASVDGNQQIKVARPVPPCRYEEVRKRADAAVLQLIELGQQLLRFYDTEGAHKLALVRKASYIKLLDFPCRLQEQALEAAKRERDTLVASKQLVAQRLDYYDGLVEEGITDLEHAAQAFSHTEKALLGIAAPFEMYAGMVDSVIPTIYGLAFGGNRTSQAPAKTASALKVLACVAAITKDELRLQADYQLRAQQWQFEADQARLELNVLDKQLLTQDVRIHAAKIALQEAHANQAAQRAEYEVMTTVFSSHATYLWLVGRMSDIYSSAYDATLSLCLMAEACLQYELGDFKSSWIKPGAWVDNWRGMLAGEALERDLIEMDNAAVLNNERPLDIRMELSLVKDLGWSVDSLRAHLEKGVIPFDLSARLFDTYYPGHYLRRIERILLTFKGEPTPKGEPPLNGAVSAMLTQTSNTLLLSDDIEGATRLYSTQAGSEQNLLRDLRPKQQAAIWYTKYVARTFELQPSVMDPTRYLPFEGTGAVSSWVLTFPGGAKTTCPALYKKDDQCQLYDIEIQVSYTALDGSKAFAEGVKDLMKVDWSQTKPSTPVEQQPAKKPTVEKPVDKAKEASTAEKPEDKPKEATAAEKPADKPKVPPATEVQPKTEETATDADTSTAEKTESVANNSNTLAALLKDIRTCDQYPKLQVQLDWVRDKQGKTNDPLMKQALRHAQVYALSWGMHVAGSAPSESAEQARKALETDAADAASERDARTAKANTQISGKYGDERDAALRSLEAVKETCRKEAVADACAAEDALYAAKQQSDAPSALDNALAAYENKDVKKTRDLEVAKVHLDKHMRVEVTGRGVVNVYEGIVSSPDEEFWTFKLLGAQDLPYIRIVCGVDLRIIAPPLRLNTMTPDLQETLL